MTRSRLLVGVASVLAGTTAVLVVFGLVYNPIILVAAVPFGAATGIIWSHATGRLDARMRQRARIRRPGSDAGFGRGDRERRRAPRERSRRTLGGRGAGPSPPPGEIDAARVLGVEPDADEAAIRRAYREKAKDLHPDAPAGDEAAFRRVRDAYERLRSDG